MHACPYACRHVPMHAGKITEHAKLWGHACHASRSVYMYVPDEYACHAFSIIYVFVPAYFSLLELTE